MKGIICLHHRNYKLILVDKTDWIYLEFLDCSSSINKEQSEYIKVNYLLKETQIDLFNIFVEILNLKSTTTTTNMNDTLNKKIFYLQTDLSKCNINLDKNVKDIQSQSFIKTTELNRIFQVEQVPKFYSETVDETFDEIKQFEFELNELELTKSNFYLFKIQSKGAIHQMNNTQFKSKLRADFQIELIPFDTSEKIDQLTTKHAVLCLSSKYLFYYSFLHVDKFYLLKSSQKLDIDFVQHNCKRVLNVGVLFMSEHMFIIDNYSVSHAFNHYINLIKKFTNSSCISTNLNENFKFSVRGVLLSKQVKTTQLNNQSQSLINYYDILIPFQELTLSIQVNESDIVTVYYDTKHSLYPMCILPGMRIDVFNLIKKSSNIYKSNSFICSSHFQDDFILSNVAKRDSTQKEKSIIDRLSEINHAFDVFYFKTNESKLDRRKLLFGSDSLQFIGQVVRIYDLSIKMKCSKCNILHSSCACITKQTRIEINFNLLVDDHSSLVKINYSDSNYDFKYHRSEVFAPIGEFLNSILLSYFSEIKLENIPLQANVFDTDQEDMTGYYESLNKKITDDIRERLKASSSDQQTVKSNETTINSYVDESTSSTPSDLDNFFENNVKIDLYKTLYDYLVNCFIEKYFVFFLNTNENYTNEFAVKKKLEFCLFKLSEINSNEQYKSILTVKCSDFCSIDKLFLS